MPSCKSTTAAGVPGSKLYARLAAPPPRTTNPNSPQVARHAVQLDQTAATSLEVAVASVRGLELHRHPRVLLLLLQAV